MECVALTKRCAVAGPNRKAALRAHQIPRLLALVLNSGLGEVPAALVIDACVDLQKRLVPERELAVGAHRSGHGALTPRDNTLAIPDVEALHVELNRPQPFTDPFHDEVGFRDHFFARHTYLTVARSAPDARDVVLRQATVGQFGSNKDTEGVGDQHMSLSVWRDGDYARFTRVSTLCERQPERPRCRRGKGITHGRARGFRQPLSGKGRGGAMTTPRTPVPRDDASVRLRWCATVASVEVRDKWCVILEAAKVRYRSPEMLRHTWVEEAMPASPEMPTLPSDVQPLASESLSASRTPRTHPGAT